LIKILFTKTRSIPLLIFAGFV